MISTPKSRHLTSAIPKWQPATWEDYLAYADDPNPEIIGLFFNQGYLFVQMGNEGINHAAVNELFTMLFFIWFVAKPGQIFHSLGGCLMEKPNTQAASPDLVLYLGEDYPIWREGERRYLNLNQWRVPDLVGEVGDTSIATDLDKKKQLYAALQIPKYWVIDVKSERVLAFRLQDDGKYQQYEYSVTLEGLPISLLEQTLSQLKQGTNGSAAIWFAQQIASL
ncbi:MULTISPECIES: Uma2 family endonuclease [Cyanophyceae]|uniref:Uma2 family endonuclease n=1 Tax=Cyanophyceae TaxID=3028117 RepID=UPI001686EF6F|nr:Uma2 family endonuclease [Trichocoleus sp. FACHB-69]MBD1930409.1 Uma2 family endonuclease [Trichocoleus sp. FACHB-69]